MTNVDPHDAAASAMPSPADRGSDRGCDTSWRIDRDADVVVAAMVGELDLATADGLRSDVEHAVDGGGAVGVVVDLEDVSFVDSQGVRVLFELQRGLTRRRQQLAVVMPSDTLAHRALAITKLDEIVQLLSTRDRAVAAVHAGVSRA